MARRPQREAPATIATLAAPAKINLTLEVVGRLANGYHAIRSIFVRLDKLTDTIELRIANGETRITLSTNSSAIPVDPSNICHRAAARYLSAAAKDARVHIDIQKRIPVGAGLGGGSSDAASVLAGLNAHFGSPLSLRQLEAMGAEIGKDVPFFIRGAKVAHVSGMGEIVKPITASPRLHFLIVHPGIAVSTADAYRALDQALWFMSSGARTDVSKAMARAMRSGHIATIAAALHNDFEGPIEQAHFVVKDIKQAMRAFGARGALMSGSGSTVFGIYDSPKLLSNANRNLRQRYPDFVIALA